ncbi:MAG: C1 family peptidase [Lachnospiraceae bacterium]|nr:C1 family peptidase [Lachnospiraceae bacterium]
MARVLNAKQKLLGHLRCRGFGIQDEIPSVGNNKNIRSTVLNKKIDFKDLKKFESKFDKNEKNRIAMNAVTANGIVASAKNYEAYRKERFGFSVEVEAGKVCNQKQSGRCWMFAAYNVMRLEVMKKLNLENMELSQNYPLFFDKLEKANHFLECMIKTIDESLDSRVVSFLMSAPMSDGGQWDMFRSIVKKYGVVPKNIMPETSASSATRELDDFLTKKLREFTCALRKEHAAGKGEKELRKLKEEMMETIYRMLCISLGKPPVTFDWEVRDKDKNFVSEKNITPVEFFNKYVGWDLDDYVTVINAPTADKPYGKTYTVRYLGNVEEGDYPVKYLNLPMDDLRDLAIRQLKDGKAVWFGSDVGQFSDRKGGYLTSDILEVDKLFDTTFGMDKAERLDYYESLMTHAMVITGVDLDENGRPLRWKVENSWGKDVGEEGFYVMDDKWFGEYAYQILLSRKYLSKKQKKMFEAEPIVLAPWDPMGSLARNL